MITIPKGYLILFLLVSGCTVNTHATDNLQMFPPAEDAMVRYVLQLPKQQDETAFKVELIVGKTVRVDTNRYFFAGKIKKETIRGWGYSRYIVNTLGPMAGTLMAADPDVPKTDRFITLGGEAYFIRYNSRVPVVVYVPEAAEVRYRIWRAGNTRTIKQNQTLVSPH